MKVAEILEAKGSQVVTIRGSTSVTTALHRLALERIGAMVVSEDGKHIDGIISERDIIRVLAEEGTGVLEPERQVSTIMTTAVRTCTKDDTVKHVMDMMTRHRVRHLPVIEDDEMVGVISIGDVVKNRLGEMEIEANVLREAYLAAH